MSEHSRLNLTNIEDNLQLSIQWQLQQLLLQYLQASQAAVEQQLQVQVELQARYALELQIWGQEVVPLVWKTESYTHPIKRELVIIDKI